MFGIFKKKENKENNIPVINRDDIGLDKLRADILARHNEREKERAEIRALYEKQFEEVDKLSAELENINNRLRSLTK